MPFHGCWPSGYALLWSRCPSLLPILFLICSYFACSYTVYRWNHARCLCVWTPSFGIVKLSCYSFILFALQHSTVGTYNLSSFTLLHMVSAVFRHEYSNACPLVIVNKHGRHEHFCWVWVKRVSTCSTGNTSFPKWSYQLAPSAAV